MLLSIYDILINNYSIVCNNISLIKSDGNYTYKICSADEIFVLKVYNISFPDDILTLNNIVSDYYNIDYIVKTNYGKLYIAINCYGKDIFCVLYRWFEGNNINLSVNSIYLCGLSLYKFHLFNIGNYCNNDIRVLNIDFEPVFKHCDLSVDSINIIDNIYDYIIGFNTSLLNNYEISYCHGDCHFNNFIINDKVVYLIDFDYAHIDYILYDITYIIWTCFYWFRNTISEILNFLHGYSGTNFEPFDFKIIEYFFMKIELSYIYYCLQKQLYTKTVFINNKLLIKRLNMSYDLNSYVENINCLMLNQKRRLLYGNFNGTMDG